MKFNLRSIFQNRFANDIFKATQYRLTFLYSGLLILFLILFIIVVYSIVYTVMLNDQKHETESLAKEEARIALNFLLNDQNRPGFRNPRIVFSREDQFFYYITNTENEVMLGDERIPDLRPTLTAIINDWHPGPREFLFKSVDVNVLKREHRKDFEQHDLSTLETETRTINLIITGLPLIFKGQVIGTIYIGKDISFFYDLLRWLLLILITISVAFFGIALFLSNLMSKRAMIPISNAFTRQREFVADASHELRTPLSVLLSSINAIEMTDSLEAGSYPRKILFNMKEEVKRMTKLVGDLLTLARSDSGSLERINETFDFRVHAENAVESVQSLANSKQIILHMQAPDAIVIHGDLERLKQLLYILLDNAVKYTPNGGNVNVTLAFENGDKGKQFFLQVKDSGIGINRDDQERIFERFYRVDKARTRQLGGYGLGLSIAKWIVDIHGGTINVSSESNNGSTFTIRIPMTN